jgi:hypothetical protein
MNADSFNEIRPDGLVIGVHRRPSAFIGDEMNNA